MYFFNQNFKKQNKNPQCNPATHRQNATMKKPENKCSLVRKGTMDLLFTAGESINQYHQFGNSNSSPSYIPDRIHVFIVHIHQKIGTKFFCSYQTMKTTQMLIYSKMGK